MWKYTRTGLRPHYISGTSKDGKNGIALCGRILPLNALQVAIDDRLPRCAKCEAEFNRPKWK